MGQRASSDKNSSEIPMGSHEKLAASDTEDGARQPRTLSDITQCDGERKTYGNKCQGHCLYLLATSELLNHEDDD